MQNHLPKLPQKQKTLSEILREYFPATYAPDAQNPTILFHQIEWTERFRQGLKTARKQGHLQAGLENIEKILKREQMGLDKIQGKDAVNVNHSRILIVTNDGSPRFYRQCTRLLTLYHLRVYGFYLKTTSEFLGETLFGREKCVKSLLVTQKQSALDIVSQISEYEKKKE